MLNFQVQNTQAGQRLDLFLALSASSYSRSNIRKLLDLGKVKVNGVIEYRPNYKMNLNDVVVFDNNTDIQKKRIPGLNLPIKIAYKDNDLVIVDKPSGLKVHPTAAEDINSLLNAIYFQLDKEINNYGVALVNRIDKETSGLVVLALSAAGAWFYSRQFAEGKVEKEYIAVVKGEWLSHYGFSEVKESSFLKYNAQLARQVINKEEGEFAETWFRLLKVSADNSLALLQVKPKTGRTHQIRVHLANLGFPILGDVKYGGGTYKRLMLHAHKLKLLKLGGGELSITSTSPQEFDLE